MRVVMVEPHRVIEFPGFELRTFQCVGCGDVEKRVSFDGTRSHQSVTFVPEAAPSPEATEALAKTILGSLLSLCDDKPGDKFLK
jgi:hypothetical protein